MADVIITYETLFDLLRKEKSRQELQQLPEDFYGQVVGYVQKKRLEVDAAGGAAVASAQKPLIQYRNVQKILRELYERRERKIIEMALNRARTESNIVDTAAVLPEERQFYDGCVDLLTRNKGALLSPVLRGDAPEGVTPVVKEPAPEREPLPPRQEPDSAQIAERERVKVRFIAAVPKFLGLAGEVHGPFEPGEEAELPGKIAVVLLKKKRIELA